MELSEVLKKIHNAETERLFAITDSFSPHELLGVLTESIESYKRLRDESLTAFNKIKAQLADMESACDKIRKSKEEMELDLGASLITYNHNKDEFPHSTALRRAFEEVSKESGSIINRQSAKISEMLSDCYKRYQECELQQASAEQAVNYCDRVIKELNNKLSALTGGV